MNGRKRSVLLVGAGRMGSALLRGWLANPESGCGFVVVDPSACPEKNFGTAAASEVPFYRTAAGLPPDLAADAIILATKPQDVASAAQALGRHAGRDTLLVSVAAGVSIASIRNATHATQPIIRAMPNIGAMVGHSVTAGFASEVVTVNQRKLVEHLFTAVGHFVWLDREEDLHAVTAVSGSGPAFCFAFCEAMIAAAMAEGLSEEIARRLATGTLQASGRLIEANPSPEQLRESVTSPKGATAAGLEVLGEAGTLRSLVQNAIAAARARSVELSGKSLLSRS